MYLVGLHIYYITLSLKRSSEYWMYAVMSCFCWEFTMNTCQRCCRTGVRVNAWCTKYVQRGNYVLFTFTVETNRSQWINPNSFLNQFIKFSRVLTDFPGFLWIHNNLYSCVSAGHKNFHISKYVIYGTDLGFFVAIMSNKVIKCTTRHLPIPPT